jgi:hypothetical protein
MTLNAPKDLSFNKFASLDKENLLFKLIEDLNINKMKTNFEKDLLKQNKNTEESNKIDDLFDTLKDKEERIKELEKIIIEKDFYIIKIEKKLGEFRKSVNDLFSDIDIDSKRSEGSFDEEDNNNNFNEEYFKKIEKEIIIEKDENDINSINSINDINSINNKNNLRIEKVKSKDKNKV